MENGKTKKKYARILRITFSLLLLPTGGILVLLGIPDKIGIIVNNLGLSLIVTGIVTLFRELAILRLETAESGENIATLVHQKIYGIQGSSVGLRLAAPIRRGYEGYYNWVTTTKSQKMLFAGRSILHRIQYDFDRLGLGKCEKLLLRKLKEGSEIRILILDPRSNIVDRLAKEEDRESEALLQNLSESIQIINKLYTLMNGQSFPAKAQMYIRLYDKVPYFAYHRVDDDVLIGFYFATRLVQTSSVYLIEDENTRNHFEDYFASIFADSQPLLELSARAHDVWFSKDLYEKIMEHFSRCLR